MLVCILNVLHVYCIFMTPIFFFFFSLSIYLTCCLPFLIVKQGILLWEAILFDNKDIPISSYVFRIYCFFFFLIFIINIQVLFVVVVVALAKIATKKHFDFEAFSEL